MEEKEIMKIDGKTRLCGLIGNPVEHTLSPVIHNNIADRLGHNMVYVPFLVKEEGVENAIKGAYELNVLGMNATVPHKSAVIPFLKEIDPLAKKIGAVNTLVRVDGGYKGYNTDMTGLNRALKSEGIFLENEKVILLGAGGASRAVAFLCASLGCKDVIMLNRNYEKCVQVAKEVNDSTGDEVIKPMELSDYSQIPGDGYVCIQGTSVGLHPNVEDCVIKDMDFFNKVSVGFDLIYKPADTKFMQMVRQAGGRSYNGLKMLLFQGIDAYELWNDCQVPDELSEEILKLLQAD